MARWCTRGKGITSLPSQAGRPGTFLLVAVFYRVLLPILRVPCHFHDLLLPLMLLSYTAATALLAVRRAEPDAKME
jgi:hypothetical protein